MIIGPGITIGSGIFVDSQISGGAGIVKLEPVEVSGQDLRQLFHQPHLDRCGEIMRVHQLPGSFRDGLADLRMTVAQCRHVDTRREIDVVVAVGIAQHAPLARFERDRK